MVDANRKAFFDTLSRSDAYFREVLGKVPAEQRPRYSKEALADNELLRQGLLRVLGQQIGEPSLSELIKRARMIAPPLDESQPNEPHPPTRPFWQDATVTDTMTIAVEDSIGGIVDTDFPTVAVRSKRVIITEEIPESITETGIYRFARDRSGQTLMVYNPAEDKTRGQTDENDHQEPADTSLFGGLLPGRVALAALIPQVVYPESEQGRVKFLSDIHVRNVEGFDPDKRYAGFAVAHLPSGSWRSLTDIVKLRGMTSRDKAGHVRLHMEDESFLTFRADRVRSALSQLRETWYRLRKLGVVVNPLEAFAIDFETGQTRLIPGADAHVLDRDLFADEDGYIRPQSFEGEEDQFDPSLGFVPNVAARALFDGHLAVSAELRLKGHARSHKKDDWSAATASVVNALFKDPGIGIEGAVSHMLQNIDESAASGELSALYDYLMEFIDRTCLAKFIRANSTSRNLAKALSEVETLGVREMLLPEFRAFMASFRQVLVSELAPPEVEDDADAKWGYDRGRGIITDLLGDTRCEDDWQTLYFSYRLNKGFDQIPMFFAKELPLIALLSSNDPSLFFEIAGSRLESFNPRKEVLAWDDFGDRVRKINRFDRDPDPNGGIRPPASTTAANLGANVIAFPAGRNGTSAIGLGGIQTFGSSSTYYPIVRLGLTGLRK